MRALNSLFMLIDINTSWHASSPKLPQRFISTTTPFSSSTSFRRTCGARSSKSSDSSPSVIRRPSDQFFTGNPSAPELVSSVSTSGRAQNWTELETFLEILPVKMRKQVVEHEEIGELIEVVMDLGRKPLARFPSGDWLISDQAVRDEDLKQAILKVGDFSDDNRAGINRSLHRISAIRNRKLEIIGLTCRVGRAVSGSAQVIHDLMERHSSILVIGPPGVGKTTLIREIARTLADEHMKRVVIVDTSNEIGGDGDVPHAGIGRARRMQVPNVNMQHNVMIEAVENHMPETIIIDEIGTELEALAASTIAQRGVQLVGTAHGMTIDSIVKNPSLQILVGGIESVTLGDEEAKKRKVQKTILERKGPPAFTSAVEIISRVECRVHHRLDVTVDAILAGKYPPFETRQMDANNANTLKSAPILWNHPQDELDLSLDEDINAQVQFDEKNKDYTPSRFKKWSTDIGTNVNFEEEDEDHTPSRIKKSTTNKSSSNKSSPIHIYTYKILETDLLQVAEAMGLIDEIYATDDLGVADAILASSSELKQNPGLRSVAKLYKLPIFVIKSNTMAQMVKAVRTILGRESFGSIQKQACKTSLDIEIEEDAPKRTPTLEEIDALEEVRLAIEYIVIPGGEPVELLPRRSDIIAQQLELVRSYQLAAENLGTELNPRLQILPQKSNKKQSSKSLESHSTFGKEANLDSQNGVVGTSVTRLPFLPE